MKILTFGSCLSRYVGNEYVRLFGGDIASSVYHNRSDAFVERFIDKNLPMYPFAEMRALVGVDDPDADIDSKSDTILRNQYPEWIGKHRLARGENLIAGLNRNSYDLILIDNFMDVSARLAIKGSEGGIFLKASNGKYYTDPSWILGEHLVPADGVAAMTKIIKYFHEKCPLAKIVFMNFPWNTYEGDLDRITRSQEYQSLMRPNHTLVIPALQVPQLFQTKQRQHFKAPFYCTYAGIIFGEFGLRALTT